MTHLCCLLQVAERLEVLRQVLDCTRAELEVVVAGAPYLLLKQPDMLRQRTAEVAVVLKMRGLPVGLTEIPSPPRIGRLSVHI
jgi:hypothetical protein